MTATANLGNSVVAACEQACAVYGVACYRMQSRVFTVVGAKGRTRPMFVGQWRDRCGEKHSSGMPDLLLTPLVKMGALIVVVPLWVECKAGSGGLRHEQTAFRLDVQELGAHYLEIRDSADRLVEWFERNGVQRRP